jgi:hypothetical protein
MLSFKFLIKTEKEEKEKRFAEKNLKIYFLTGFESLREILPRYKLEALLRRASPFHVTAWLLALKGRIMFNPRRQPWVRNIEKI